MTAWRNTAAYCIFLPFGTPDSGSKFRRYQVFMSYHWASAGMTKGNRLSKRKRNVLRRDDYFYFHHYSFQICITDQAWSQYHWIYGQIPFLHFARLCRSPLFFLVGYAMRLRRLLRDLMHWGSLCSLLRTDEWSTWSKSSILFTETKSRQMKKERHQYPVIFTEQAWSKRVYLFYGQVTVVFIHNGLSCCYLVTYEQAGDQDTDLSHFLA